MKNSFLILCLPAGCLLLGKHHKEHMTVDKTDSMRFKLKKDHFGLLTNCLSECYRSQCHTYLKIIAAALNMSGCQ